MQPSSHQPLRPAAVVCDLDGLLVDSEDAWGLVERTVVEGYGRPWDESIRELLLGRGPDEAARILAGRLGVDDAGEVDRRLLAAAVDELGRGVLPRPGALALLAGLVGRGVPVGVATNSRRVLAEASLASAGLAAHVTVLVCVDDVAAAKPAPDVYLLACELLSAAPSGCVGFEDSPVGARAAQAAGLWVVGCPSLPGSVLEAADVMVSTLEGLDLDALTGRRPVGHDLRPSSDGQAPR